MIIFFINRHGREKTKPKRRETKHVRTINVNTTTLKASTTAPKLNNNTAAEKLNRTSMLMMMTDDGAEDGDS